MYNSGKRITFADTKPTFLTKIYLTNKHISHVIVKHVHTLTFDIKKTHPFLTKYPFFGLKALILEFLHHTIY